MHEPFNQEEESLRKAGHRLEKLSAQFRRLAPSPSDNLFRIQDFIENLKIINKRGELVSLIMNRSQEEVFHKLMECREKRIPARFICCKSRQLGISTLIEAFIFALIAWIFNRKKLSQTARHCLSLALIMAVPTILLGLMDWQYRFGGAWIFEIKMKFILAGILLLLLIIAVVYAAMTGTFTKTVVAIYAICLLTVIGLGYFGGELVYGTKTPAVAEATGLVAEGAQIFKQNCSACHHTNDTATKVGPGLMGVFKQTKFPISGQLVSDDNFRQILKTPYSKMPPFGHLSAEQVDALLDYLRTL